MSQKIIIYMKHYIIYYYIYMKHDYFYITRFILKSNFVLNLCKHFKEREGLIIIIIIGLILFQL